MKRLLTILIVLFLTAPTVSTPWSSKVAAQAQPPSILTRIGSSLKALKKVRGASVNRRGNNPQRERPDPLKPLNHESFFEEGVPEVLAKAAEVKKAEDLAKQKIKAIKYLTSIGCACYDIDDSITEALIKASDDCTEDVRLATVEAIKEAACSQSCQNCGSKCCCKKDMVMRLAKMAYERKDDGCWEEPSKRVREAARQALCACCPNTEPVTEIVPDELPEPEPQRIREAPTGEGDVREGPVDGVEILDGGDASDESSDENSDETTDENDVEVNYVPGLDFGVGNGQYPAGVVMQVDERLRIAHVHFEDSNLRLQRGSKMMAVVIKDGRRHWLGPLTIYESFKGSASVTVADARAFQLVQRGTPVVGTMELASMPPEPTTMAPSVSTDPASSLWSSDVAPRGRTASARNLWPTDAAPVVPALPSVQFSR